jgi:hypothetical protein
VPVEPSTAGDLTAARQPSGSDDEGDLAFWRSVAQTRGEVIRALHEFNYWHESTVARGEVIAGLEDSVAMWRERCLAAEARLQQRAPEVTAAEGVRKALRVVRRAVASRALALGSGSRPA